MDLSETTYHRLRDLIVRNQLLPEKRLIEKDLADRLDVSRTPIRDALRSLETEGYAVDSGRGRRALLAVRPIRRSDVDQIWPLLGAVEAQAVRAISLMEDGVRRELARGLRETNAQLREGAKEPPESPDRIVELRNGFHRLLIAVARNPWLQKQYDLLRPHVDRYERLPGVLQEADLPGAAEEHDRGIDLIESGDGDGAATAIQTRWERNRERTAEFVERYWV